MHNIRSHYGVRQDQSRRPAVPAHIIASLLALSPGTRLGVYEVTALIGEGGMGQVYRATDTRLKRQVAIKILPDVVRGRPRSAGSFQREAEVLASLNHPNIAGIYGLEEAAASVALVHGTGRGRGPGGPHRARPDPARRGAADRAADRGGARSGARAGDHSSRSEAGEYQGRAPTAS